VVCAPVSAFEKYGSSIIYSSMSEVHSDTAFRYLLLSGNLIQKQGTFLCVGREVSHPYDRCGVLRNLDSTDVEACHER